jgi:ferric-dicitrate binding protein FerR (iron transport regulator)
VYSRSGVYRVACVTGKVQVTSPVGEEVIIGPSYEAEIDPAGKILVTKKDNIETATSWKENMFSFTSVSIDKVIEEIERQYNVQIITQIEDRLTYTGFFSRDKHIEEVLDLLCKPFGLTYVKQADGVFLVTEK